MGFRSHSLQVAKVSTYVGTESVITSVEVSMIDVRVAELVEISDTL